MKRFKVIVSLLAVAVLALLPLQDAIASTLLATAPAGVSLSLTVGEYISVAATGSINFVNYNPQTGTAQASGPISINANWALQSGAHQNIGIYAYFVQGTRALTDGGSNTADNVSAAQSIVFTDTANGPGACNIVGTTLNPLPSFAVAGSIFCNNTLVNGSIFFQSTPTSGNFTDSMTLSLQNLPVLNANTFSGTLWINAEAF